MKKFGILSSGELLLAWPLECHILTAGYYYSNGSFHHAIDMRDAWDGKSGKPVTPAIGGTVKAVHYWKKSDGVSGMNSYGNYIDIQHPSYNGKSLMTRYAHLSTINCGVGGVVTPYTTIGTTGSTGNTQGSHLHFEVWYNNKYSNPLLWLDDDFTEAWPVYTFAKGQHSVEVPPEIALYNIEAKNITKGDVMSFDELANTLGIALSITQQ